jgi:molybdate transport system substrate-binding protein
MRRTATIFTATLAMIMSTHAQAAEIRVLTSGAIKAALADIKPLFEEASGHKLVVSSDTSGRIAKRIGDGEETDLLIVTSGGIDELAKQGRVVAGSKAVLARSGIGAVVLKGAPKPDISTPEKFKQALLAAKTVAYTSPASGGQSGIYFAKMLEQLGIADEVNKKAKYGQGGPVAAIVARGEAELGMQQIPELINFPGVDYVGPLPGNLQFFTVLAAGIPVNGKQADAAGALIRFFVTPAAIAAMKKNGMEPGGE